MSTNDQDHLYSWLNTRGTKTFKTIDQAVLAERFPEYAKIGLPAHKAALEGNVEALKDIYTSFTARGVPSRDVNGATPLHLAVRCNRVETVKWLLRFTDLSPTISAKHGETPCHVAAVLGNTECLKAMLGADVKGEICVVNDNSGFTPLHLAIVKSRNEVAKLLISELGAKGMGAVTESGITAAHVAASSGNVDVLKIIAGKNKKYLSQETSDGTTPLYYAAQEGCLAAVKFLHEKGKCDLSSPSNDGRKPIHAACQCGHTHVVKYIVSQLNNSTIFDTVPDGATTLHFAASTGQLKTARWLIDSDVGGTLINSKDSSGDTPAHDAADNGKIDTLKLLLENGADLYAINNDGNTPYSLALSSQTPGMADFIMSFASNAPQKQNEGPSQMTIFDMQGEVDVVDFTPKEQVIVEAEVEAEVNERESETKNEIKAHVPANKNEDKKLKKKEKEKKEKERKEKKQKDKKGKKGEPSGSFLQATGAALLAIPTDESNDPLKSSLDDKILDMTEEELDMFKENGKVDGDADNFVPSVPPSSDGGEIVVSYGDSTPPVKSKLSRSRLPQPDPITITEYSTVAEIERAEKKKEKKKMGRKNSKSIQKKKHEDDSSKNVEGAGAILSGSQMGFKPQFKTNPLQQLTAGIPLTPPPTPATGFSSSATSEAGMASTEDEDDMPYDMYTNDVEDRRSPEAPDDKRSSDERKEEKERVEEDTHENNIVQDKENTITNLDDEEDEDDDEEDDKKPVLKKWPPPKVVDYKPEDAKIHPSGENVLKKWQPTESDVPSTQPGKPSTSESRTHGNVMKKWPPAVTTEPNPPAPKIPSPLVTAKTPEVVSPIKNPQSNASMEDNEKSLPVKLNPVQKVGLKSYQKPDEGKQTEFDRIKLKKATKGGANYSSPSREVTSGADNELSTLLKLRQNNI